MNRRNFLGTLLAGLVSAPAIANAIQEQLKTNLVRYGGPRLWVHTETPYDPEKLKGMGLTWRGNTMKTPKLEWQWNERCGWHINENGFIWKPNYHPWVFKP